MVFFDTPNVKASEDFEILPAGEYRVMVEKSAVKDNQYGTGQYVSLTLQVLAGPFEGRKLFAIFNIRHEDEKAQRIGQGDLKRFLEAIGISQSLAKEEDFHRLVANKTCFVQVEDEKGKDGKLRNKVKRFSGKQAIVGANPIPRRPSDDLPF